MSSINDLIKTAVDSIFAGRYSERHGLVTSYDPENYLAKAMLMPEGILTGWMRIETGHIGKNYGMTQGLQVGDGTGGSGSGGDQVIVSFNEGDVSTPKIKQRVHSSVDKPPKTESGEIQIWTKFGMQSSATGGTGEGSTGIDNSNTGQRIKWKNDGSIYTEDGGGAKRTMDGKANYTVVSGNKEQNNKIEHNILNQQPMAEDASNQGAGAPGAEEALGAAQGAAGGFTGGGGSFGGGGASGSFGASNAGNAATLSGGGDVVSTLNGLLGVIQALNNAGAGAPGVASIGEVIASMSGEILAAGGTVSQASAITNLGSQMAAGAGGAGMAGLIGQLSGMLGQLGGMGGMAGQVKHYTKLDNQKGTKAAAFQDQHWTTWDQQGVTHSSSQKSTTRAPQIQHQGQVSNSDNVFTTKSDFAAAHPKNSDVRLKIKIEDAPSVLDKVMSLKVKMFEKYPVWYGKDGKQSIGIGPPRPSIGLIAQEVREHFPELIHGNESDTEFLSLDESAVGVVLLAAFQEFVTEVRGELARMRE